jgi:uncharacterized protein (TIGR02246 family)
MMALMLAFPSGARPPERPRAAIVAALEESARGWNRGDVDGFLAVYSDDPATSFTGKSIERGKPGIRARYLASYKAQFGPGNAATRSTLTFDVQDFRMLGDRHALLIARWKLVTPGKADPDTGMTSLVFRQEAGGWHIIADHSS